MHPGEQLGRIQIRPERGAEKQVRWGRIQGEDDPDTENAVAIVNAGDVAARSWDHGKWVAINPGEAILLFLHPEDAHHQVAPEVNPRRRKAARPSGRARRSRR